MNIIKVDHDITREQFTSQNHSKATRFSGIIHKETNKVSKLTKQPHYVSKNFDSEGNQAIIQDNKATSKWREGIKDTAGKQTVALPCLAIPL